jgi:hypothetical protein
MPKPTTAPDSTALCGRVACAGRAVGVLLGIAWALGGCSLEQVVGTNLPPDVPNPATTHTAAGAVAAYYGALALFRNAVGGSAFSFVPISGLLTDELQSGRIGLVGSVTDDQLLDSRRIRTDLGQIVAVYGLLQQARGQSEEAHGLMLAYAPDSTALVGHLDALQGYTEVYLTDLFCSGIPLSTLDFNGNFTYQVGSTTEEVYATAAALFDSALSLAGDSARILNLARVGKGRVLLAVGQYAAAAQAVTSVPDGFRYTLDFSSFAGSVSNLLPVPYPNRNFMWQDDGSGSEGLPLTMVDREGGDGLPFMLSGDPRSAWVPDGTNANFYPITVPAKYDLTGDSSIVIASGVEARLIEAEAALNSGDPSWLTRLNALRTDGTYDTVRDPNDTTKTDTLWHAGTGGVTDLAPLADPGMLDARVDLVIQERGYWLFLTGERQGDLRRLIREYGRQQQTVYPTGSYPGAYGSYGTDVTAPIPSAEQVSNPLFKGCISRGA